MLDVSVAIGNSLPRRHASGRSTEAIAADAPAKIINSKCLAFPVP
jgi:hypothetical protein